MVRLGQVGRGALFVRQRRPAAQDGGRDEQPADRADPSGGEHGGGRRRRAAGLVVGLVGDDQIEGGRSELLGMGDPRARLVGGK
ncbi:hypothetical protein, partial [Geodermatophilus sp. SYSU D00710]